MLSCISGLVALVPCTSRIFGVSAICAVFQSGLVLIGYAAFTKRKLSKCFFTTRYNPPDSINLRWPHHINPSTRIRYERNMTRLLNAAKVHFILTIPTYIHERIENKR